MRWFRLLEAVFGYEVVSGDGVGDGGDEALAANNGRQEEIGPPFATIATDAIQPSPPRAASC